MRLFDSHSHIQGREFAAGLPDVLARATAAGVVGVAVCGYDPESNQAAIALAATSPQLFPTVGYHPHDANEVTPAALAELESLARRPEVVAVGEIGLDFYRDLSPREVQRRVLNEQLGIAVRVGKPVCVHSRAAEEEIYEHLTMYAGSSPLRGRGRPVGVMHCFGGTLEQARRYVELGFVVSIPCTITYQNNTEARRIAAGLPLSALVVETDSPYLPPRDLRGKRNEPANVLSAVEGLAAARGIAAEAAAEATTANACQLFGVSIPVKAGAL